MRHDAMIGFSGPGFAQVLADSPTLTARQVFGLLEPALTDYAVRPVRWHEPVSSSG
ncbi:hypothetical protein [Nonomuraea bangladeshensis]|uniref:hypothetical protein n=1 Tax=Nonomuraea bangladeshensis TaxID=404385 RepID=UPI003C2B0F9C